MGDGRPLRLHVPPSQDGWLASCVGRNGGCGNGRFEARRLGLHLKADKTKKEKKRERRLWTLVAASVLVGCLCLLVAAAVLVFIGCLSRRDHHKELNPTSGFVDLFP